MSKENLGIDADSIVGENTRTFTKDEYIAELEAKLSESEEEKAELKDEIAGWKAAAESTYFDNLAMLEELGE